MQHNQEETHTVALPCRREHELVRTFVIHCQTDIDFDSMGFFIPLTSPQKLRLTFKYIRDRIGVDVEDDIVYIPTVSELAVAFAFSTSSFARLGYKDFAYQLYEKTREIIFPVLEKVDEDIEIASAMTYLALYLSSIGENTRARFFKENAQQSCSKFLRNYDKERHGQAKLLQQVLLAMDNIVDDNFDVAAFLNYLFTFFNTSCQFFDCYHHIETHDKNQSTSDLMAMITQIADRYDAYKDIVPSSDIASKKSLLIMTALGTKLKYMRQNNIYDDKSLEIADEIVLQIKLEHFTFSTPFACMSIAEAALVHSHFLLENKSNALINQITWEIWGLKILSERHALAKVQYGGLIAALENCISRSTFALKSS